jgi:outer membrane lipoprotein-sorting protein
MRSPKILFACLLLISLTIATTLSAPFQTALTPRQILARMAAVYANCVSYRDEGKVVSPYEEISFATLFERPSRFRFEYSRSSPRADRYVIWRTAPGEAQSWWTIRRDAPNQSLNMAIATATGVSAASSHNIPRLLMPDEVNGFSFALDNWVDVTSAEEESVNGRLCYKLSGHYPASPTMPVTLWVDKETFLVRKVFSNSATVTYSPQLNVEIDQSTFQFERPLVR